MSTLRVDSITSRVGGTAPSFPNGVQVTGVVTATKFVGDASGLTNIPAAGNSAAYASVAGVSTVTAGLQWNMYGQTVGIITAAGFVATGSTGIQGVWGGDPIGTTRGGTGQNTYTTGDILYASSSNTLSKLTVGSVGQVLTIAGGVPSWANASGGGGSGAGLGYFNTGITTSVGYTITSSLTAGITLPSTASTRYLIHSVHVMNIDPNAVTTNLTSDLTGTNYSINANLAYLMPVPGNAAVELISRPKIMYPSGTIRFQGSSSSTLAAQITYETSTDTNYFGNSAELTSTSATDVTTATTADAVIESIFVSNIHGVSDGKIILEWTDAANSRLAYYGYNIIIPAGGSVEILEAPKLLPRLHKIRATANVANRMEVIVSGKFKA
jgi:hypothetical protein